MEEHPPKILEPQKLKDEDRIYCAKNGKWMTAKELIKSIRGRIQPTLRIKNREST